MRAVRFFDGGSIHAGILGSDGRVRADPTGIPAGESLITGRFTDHHVHLQLVDHARLASSRLGRVLDLGADLEWVAKRSGRSTREVIGFAGPFLTAPGGYPTDRTWMPASAAWEVTDAAAAELAVARLADHGAVAIKVVAHDQAGPTLADEVIRSIVHAAARAGLLVVAHAEGAGQAQRVARLGVDMLAHAPFTERLSDAEIGEQAAAVTWISTLAIHDDARRRIAVDNVRRFAAAGGTVRYGTDMGNGDTPVDLRAAELDALREAGIDEMTLLAALAPLSPLSAKLEDLLLLPGDDPRRARSLTAADLES